MSILLFPVNDKLYLRDPMKTLTGQTIISKSIEMIDKLGFDQFTFRKLAENIQSTEPTIYRYFENKHHLLHYLIDCYWTLVNFRIDFCINNIHNPEEKLKICLQLLSGSKKTDGISHLDEPALHRIVICELEKAYLSKNGEKVNKEKALPSFSKACQKISSIIKEINPKYPFPNSLVSTAIHAANHQIYYARHLPSLSDMKDTPKDMHSRLYQFLEGFVLNTIRRQA